MYLCNCNGLRVTDVVKACMEGVSKAADVFACYGVEECCGKCIPEIEECLESSNQQTTFQNAVPKIIDVQNTGSI